jgi:2'-hydroxyisoflavone reductase
MDRRDFVKGSLLTTTAFVCSDALCSAALALGTSKSILVLGGTYFLGPALVEAGLAAGHTITLFNRGVTNPDLFPHVERLRGFRSTDATNQDLSALGHRHFDVVVDVWPNEPNVVASAAEFLKDRTSHYLFVSSVGAYDSKEYARDGTREDAPLQAWNSPARAYNRNKAESERRLHQIVGERLTIVRPGPIQGERDETSDLLTWLLRAQEGDDHIAPGDGNDPVELVDVKDVARFLLLAINRSLFGTFNLTGRQMTFREFLAKCQSAVRSEAKFVWIPTEFLHEHGLESDIVLHTFAGNFPLWRPDPTNQGLYRVSSEKAFRAGWQTRAFDETAVDCLTDFYEKHTMAPSTYLTREKEKEVLTAWKQRS